MAGLFESITSWMTNPNRTQQMQGIGGWLKDWPNKFEENQRTQQLASDYLHNKLLGSGIVTPEQEAANRRVNEDLAGAMNPVGMVIGRGVSPLAAQEATDLLKAGTPLNEIFRKTGLVQVPTKDGVTWGRQISDANATINKDALEQLKTIFQQSVDKKKGLPGYEIKLQDILDHPELFQNYPELAQMRVNKVPGLMVNTQGYYSPSDKSFGLAGLNPYLNTPGQIAAQLENQTKTSLHEVMHAIQDIEKWPRGGSPAEFKKAATKPATEQLTWSEKELTNYVNDAFKKQNLKPYPGTIYGLADLVKRVEARGVDAIKYYPTETKEAIQAVINSPEKELFLKASSRLAKLRNKIESRETEAFNKYQSIAGEAQSRAIESQFGKRGFSNDPYNYPATDFYDQPIENLIYQDPFKPTIP